MWHVQARRIKLFHTKKHDFDLTVFPSTIAVSGQKALDFIEPVIFEPSNLSSEDQSFDSCSEHSDYFVEHSRGNKYILSTDYIHLRHSGQNE